jgi:hypothetical protein
MTDRTGQRTGQAPRVPDSALRWRPPAVAAHLARELPTLIGFSDRLLDVAVEAGREEPLAVPLHCQRRQRDDRMVSPASSA